jgi:hypothetical protein
MFDILEIEKRRKEDENEIASPIIGGCTSATIST